MPFSPHLTRRFHTELTCFLQLASLTRVISFDIVLSALLRSLYVVLPGFLFAILATAKMAQVDGAPPLRVQIGTFNCNFQGSTNAVPDLTHWLVPTIAETSDEYTATDEKARVSDGREAPDFYAVGFQELMPLHDGFASNEQAEEAIARTDRAIRRAIRPQSAVTRKDGKYPSGGGPEDYSLVATARIVGIVLFVYARERATEVPGGPMRGVGSSTIPSAVSRIKEIRTATVGTGIFNLLGNKGAAAVRLALAGASPDAKDEVITFVTAHLAAHDHNVPRRNADWRNIVSRLVFTPSSVSPLPLTASAPSKHGVNVEKSQAEQEKDVQGLTEKYKEVKSTQGNPKGKTTAKALDGQTHGIYETSHLFVFGDLNYRIGFNVKPSPTLSRQGSAALPLKKADIKRKINQADWRTLATYDQLSLEHTHSDGPRVFHGLIEPPVTELGYPPTYKYKVDKAARKAAEKSAASGDYDIVDVPASQASEQSLSGKRVPGWTDRILWASAGGALGSPLQGVFPEVFRSIMRYTHSDHKPVTAILRLPPAPGKHLDATLRPFAIDPSWRLKNVVGRVLDRIVGLAWCSLIAAGAGNLVVGILELVVIAALSAWWLLAGGGPRGDIGYMLGNILGRP